MLFVDRDRGLDIQENQRYFDLLSQRFPTENKNFADLGTCNSIFCDSLPQREIRV